MSETQSGLPAIPAPRTSMQRYLDSAKRILDKFGITERPSAESQLAALLEEALVVDQARATAVMRVVQYMGSFNALIRDKIEEQNFSGRYEKITEAFDSIREDTNKLVQQAERGKVTKGERIGRWWMSVTRGTPHKRFEKIRDTYNGVSNDTKEQLDREEEIMNAYLDFRMALKGAETTSAELLNMQTIRLDASKTKLGEKQKAVDDYKGNDDAQKGELELARDEAKREYDNEDRRYQLIKDVKDNLTVGYNVGEALMARLGQSHGVKSQVYRRGVTFFTTNEHVFTTLDAVYASLYGLAEATKSLEAMTEGVNRGLEQVATVGAGVMRQGVKAGYGAGIKADSVRALVDSIVAFQEEQYTLIEQARREATEEAGKIEILVNDGKRRYAEVIARHNAEAPKVTVMDVLAEHKQV